MNIIKSWSRIRWSLRKSSLLKKITDEYSKPFNPKEIMAQALEKKENKKEKYLEELYFLLSTKLLNTDIFHIFAYGKD